MDEIEKARGKFNLPQSKLPYDKTEDEVFLTMQNVQWQVFRIIAETIDGFDFISKHEKSVTIFGSARLPESNPYYKKAQKLGKEISKIGYTVVTGGGPGIMEAANRGSYSYKKGSSNNNAGSSLGLNIKLPNEQRINPFVEEGLPFRFFFIRKLMLSFAAECYIYFPGGFGTMDELFEILTLVQCKKIARVPIILFGKKFWQPIQDAIENTFSKEFKTIDKEDMDLYQITDDIEEVLEVIKKAPIRRFFAPDNLT